MTDTPADEPARVVLAGPGEDRKIRVFLLDDHEVVRRGLKDLLEADGDICQAWVTRNVRAVTWECCAAQRRAAAAAGLSSRPTRISPDARGAPSASVSSVSVSFSVRVMWTLLRVGAVGGSGLGACSYRRAFVRSAAAPSVPVVRDEGPERRVQ